MTLSRRELFAWFRLVPARAAPAVASGAASRPGPAGFSLDEFYATRSSEHPVPPFAIRDASGCAASLDGGRRTAVGDEAAAPRQAHPAIAPGMVPQVLVDRCLATRSFCSVCVERCPVAGAIVVEGGRPRIDGARCDGCGRCVAACPAPILAFALVARPCTEPAR